MAKKHIHGEMNTEVQEETFDGFVRWSIRLAVFSIGVLVFLALFNS